jgi:hypothetical protein
MARASGVASSRQAAGAAQLRFAADAALAFARPAQLKPGTLGRRRTNGGEKPFHAVAT